MILPQATKIAIPNIGSMLIGMVKDTSVLFVIGLTELFATVQNLASVSYEYFTLYTAAAVLYIAVAFIVDFAFRTTREDDADTTARTPRSRGEGPEATPGRSDHGAHRGRLAARGYASTLISMADINHETGSCCNVQVR